MHSRYGVALLRSASVGLVRQLRSSTSPASRALLLGLVVLLVLIPATAAMATGQSSHRHHVKARAGHRRVRHTARCARRARHARYRGTRHPLKHHSRHRRSGHSSCVHRHHRSASRHSHHAPAHHHAAAQHHGAGTSSHPALSHAAEGPGANGTVTIASPSSGPCEGVSVVPSEEGLATARAATLCLVNRERAAHGEGPLATNTDLQSAAQAHSESMASGAYFEHSGPGGSFMERIMASGYLSSPNALYNVGENIAFGSMQDATPASIVAAWMGSAGHRANILNSSFREIGIGISPHLPASLGGGSAGAMYTEDFGVVV
jgi:uncharacterized protein YkwD